MVDWIEPGVLAACSYPSSERALQDLSEVGVTLIINLDPRPHDAGSLERQGLRELHLPAQDWTAPSQSQIDACLAAVDDARRNGERVAVHCAAGLGRTGTVSACYLVSRGMGAEEAIARVRQLRPGSIETDEQVKAVHAFAKRQ